VDQQKAFDSVLHGFCDDAFRFFGFGENFINMMSILGNARCARIQLEDGKLSDSFPLERGRAQGDSPSPRQYNIAEQVFLLKLEFDPAIRKINYAPVLERPLPDFSTGTLIHEDTFLGTGTEKTESFADDANILTLQKYECVKRVRDLMNDFYSISGLKCNVDKTTIMFIGPDDEEEQIEIRKLGFLVVDKIKCLGIEVYREGGGLEKNFTLARKKVFSLIGDWSSYGLSTHGRIAVAKTFLISQVTYLGSILTPPPDTIKELKDMIDNFVLRGRPWSKKTLYQPPEDGGLGLIKLDEFFLALKCSWIKRISKDGINDNWRLSLMTKFFLKPICIRPHLLDPDMPLEYGIGSAFWQFLTTFWKLGKNVLYAPLVYNPLFIRGLTQGGMADTRLIDENLIGIENYRRDQSRWLSLRCCDFFTGTGIKSYNEVITNVNPNITFNLYMAFRRSIAFTFKKLKLDGISGNTGCNIDSLILSKNKKSILFRIWFTKASCIKTSGMNLIQKLCDITNCQMPDQDVISKNLGCWNISFLPVHLKEFALQLSRNSLPVNARLAARYRLDPDITIDEGCRLCRKNSVNGPIPRETFAHFFYDCTITNTLINGF
jgi:hypothetical protein